MNNKRRAKINRIIQSLEGIRQEVDFVLSAEEDGLDNIPENLQCSELYENIEAAASSLSNSVGFIEDAISCLEEAVD